LPACRSRSWSTISGVAIPRKDRASRISPRFSTSCDPVGSTYRISEKAPDFAEVTPLAQALVAANPERIVWGTDWPHPNSDYGRGKPLTEISPPFPIDDGLLLNQLPKWVPDAALRKKILVDNPARLYGFAAVAG